MFAAIFNCLIQWVVVTYVLLNISVANSHATSAYECELLFVTWHYLPSVWLDNVGSVIRLCRYRDNIVYFMQFFHKAVSFYKRSKIIAAFNLVVASGKKIQCSEETQLSHKM